MHIIAPIVNHILFALLIPTMFARETGDLLRRERMITQTSTLLIFHIGENF